MMFYQIDTKGFIYFGFTLNCPRVFFLSAVADGGLLTQLALTETRIRKFCIKRDYSPEASQLHRGHDCRPGEYI